MKKLLASIVTGLAVILLLPAVAMAHVIVTPGQVGVGQELTFNVSVPNEQQTPVVDVLLRIPSGVTDVVPTTKDGWTINTTTDGNSKDPEVNSIVWSGGQIPVGQREDFSFSAQVPANATDLHWSAYQTYGDGTVVHWDQKPNGSDDSTGNAGPYSVTHVVNDLGSTSTAKASTNTATTLSIIALVVSIGSLLLPLLRRPTKQ